MEKLKLHYIDYKNFYSNYDEVTDRITRMRQGDPTVLAYGKKNSFVIMEKICKNFAKIYDVEVTRAYMHIVKMEYIRYKNQCFIYECDIDNNNSYYLYPTYPIEEFLEFVLKQDSIKTKEAKKEIKKYTRRIEFESNKNYIYCMMLPAVMILFALIMYFLK